MPSNKDILIIDDDLVTRKIIIKNLVKNGYDVIETDKASKAMKLLNENEIDLVLCDIVMDDMDGFEFCNIVRQEEKYKALPFIFVSSKDSPEDRARALSLGADDYITKPVNADNLLLKVQSLLKRVEIYKQFSVRQKINANLTDEQYKILILDDDPVLQKVLTQTLEKKGLECVSAMNVNDAMEKVKQVKPDLILSDLVMPDINGFEFRKMLLKDPILSEIPFVFLTSVEEESSIIEGYDLDIKDFISKAQNPKVIGIKVKNVLDTINKERRKSVLELQQVASSMSIEVVPEKPNQLDGFFIKQLHIPYKGMPGGDFLDYIPVDDDRMVIIVGDVMGKQWGAWFFTFSFIGYIRSAIRVAINSINVLTAGDVMKNVNSAIYKDAKVSEIFSTVTCVILDRKNYTAEYTGAGDLSILVHRAATGNVDQFESQGLLLGISEDGEYDNIKIQMEPEDEMIIFTDGITDSRSKDGKAFGMSQVIETLKGKSTNGLKFDQLKDSFMKYTQNIFDDDITLIGIQRVNNHN
jgi:sigma-B regulation protein RsbU (phosphoserine phosphatase)